MGCGAGAGMDVGVDAIVSAAANAVVVIVAAANVAVVSVAAGNAVGAEIVGGGIIAGWRDRVAVDGIAADVRCSRRICRRSVIC